MKQNKDLEVKNKKTIYAKLHKFCSFSMGDRKAKGDYVEVTEWLNGEGYDIIISDVMSHRQFMLTSGQFEAIKKCIRALEEYE